jgi:hypothetical protein
MEKLSKYREFYTGTDNSTEIQAAAKSILEKSKNSDIASVFVVVRQFVNDACYDKSSGKPVAKRKASNLLESRRVKASELINDCIASCGSMATLATSLLRNMGYAVKLVHGSHVSSEHHAWIEIYNEDTGKWEAYDLTGYGDKVTGKIGSDYTKILDCADWYDIKEFLIKEHKRWVSKREERQK